MIEPLALDVDELGYTISLAGTFSGGMKVGSTNTLSSFHSSYDVFVTKFTVSKGGYG